ncbi:MAG: 6-carboxytetrahydropterin synthase [Deltaproteobacteria bacterium]|nr:6-carboxytetrahydropterin synthase [Deltaproteobacteria bacterium]
MYAVAVERDFTATHFLVGGDWGPENDPHQHYYKVEAQVEGRRLDRHGYLVDIVELEAALDDLVARFRNSALNELPEFQGLNPSIEHFCRIICHSLRERLHGENLSALTVKIWESAIAWASFRQEVL